MSYGYELYNDSGNIVASSNDRTLVTYAKYTLSGSSVTNQITYDYIPGAPYNVSGQTTLTGCYTFGLPGGFTMADNLFLGFTVPVGRSVFVRYLYKPAGRLIISDQPTLTMVVAGPLQSVSSYPATWGMIGYNDVGTATFHSDARVLKILKRIDGTSFNAGGHSPVFFMSGNYFYHKLASGTRRLRMTGVRLDSATTYTRRCNNNVGVSLVADQIWETDPLGNGFLASVDLTLI